MTARAWRRLALALVGMTITAYAIRWMLATIPLDSEPGQVAVFCFALILGAMAWGRWAAVEPIDEQLVIWPVSLRAGETYVLQVRRSFTMAERAKLLADVEQAQARFGCKFFLLDAGLELVTSHTWPLEPVEGGEL